MANLHFFTRYILTILFATSLLTSINAYSLEKEYVRTYTYQASEKDSKLSARNAALEQVQHKLLSELGTYVKSKIDSSADSTGRKFSQHEINTLTAGIIKTEIIEEKWDGRNYFIKARLLVDPEDITKKIQAEIKKQTKYTTDSSEKSGRSKNTYTTALTSSYKNHSNKILMETSRGNVTLELYPDKAPRTVENFLSYTNEGAYDGTIFHRVIKNFMNQGGGFTVDYAKKKSNAPIPNEATNRLKNKRGTIAMARTMDPHSATNQFFINTADNTFLDHTGKNMRGWGYTVFGRVVSGMDTMERIANVKTGAGGPFRQDLPQEPIIIFKITEIKPKAKAEK